MFKLIKTIAIAAGITFAGPSSSFASPDFETTLRAAEQGDAQAQFTLGVKYYTGVGVRQDMHQAVVWFTKAAEQGYAKGQFNLGYMYYSGEGVRQNESAAREWFGKACDNGIEDGCKAYANLNRILSSPQDQSRSDDELQKLEQEIERLRAEANNKAKKTMDDAIKSALE